MNRNRSPRNWSSVGDPDRATRRGPDKAPPEEATDNAVERLGNVLDMYAPPPTELAVVAPIEITEEPEVEAEPLYYATLASEPAQAPLAVVADFVELDDAHGEPAWTPPAVAVDGSPLVDTVDTIVARLADTRGAISEALARCGSAAEDITAISESVRVAAAQLARAVADQTDLHNITTVAIRDLESLRDELGMLQARATAEAEAMLDRTRREAEQLRADALADAERARERLMRFTTELGNVASELKAALSD